VGSASTSICRASARRCSLPFDALFASPALREAVSDEAWLRALLEAERALATAEARVGIISEQAARAVAAACSGGFDVAALAEEGRAAGNPVEPLVRALRRRAEFAHWGATSQDVLDSAMAVVARDATALVVAELDGVAEACAALAERHRGTVTAARTLLQQAVPTTFGLKAASWLVGVVHARDRVSASRLPAQLGGAGGTLAALGDRGPQVLRAYAEELGLPEPVLPWHTRRLPVAELGAALAIAAGFLAKVALDVALLAQTEVGEVREPAGGRSSTMPHKRNPVGSTLARACALRVQGAAAVLLAAIPQEHERAAGAWHAEWDALCEALVFTGGAGAHVRETLAGLEVDAERMRGNIARETLSEAERFGMEPAVPDEYLGSADAFVERALDANRRA
jgi:3-carboxy-cis,cis-muconate cycloisomerase